MRKMDDSSSSQDVIAQEAPASRRGSVFLEGGWIGVGRDCTSPQYEQAKWHFASCSSTFLPDESKRSLVVGNA